MEIVLVRHGKPVSASNERLNSKGFGYWVKRYHHADIASSSLPSWDPLTLLEGSYVVASDLKRAIASAQIGFGRSPQQTFSCLREMDIPRYNLPLTLRAWTWVYLNRGLWMLGKQGKFESYRAAKLRAQTAAGKLVALANTHDKVVSMGHGFMNLHIRRHLKRKGWQVIQKNNDYWGVSVLRSPD